MSVAGIALDTAPPIAIGLREELGWRRVDRNEVTLWFKGGLIGDDAEALAARMAAGPLDKDGAARLLAELDGFFALAASGPGWGLAAVDRVRSIPLLWAEDGADALIDQDGPRLADRLGLGPADVDRDAALSIALAGFTISDDTLYGRVRQLTPGTFLFAAPGQAPAVHRYHRWTPWLPEAADPDDLVAPLAQLHERLIEKTIKAAAGRRIVVPLSAGLDSRFIVAGLREAGYDNVTCFAYGRAGNREAVISERVAARLGYPWRFVPFDNAMVRAAMAGTDHARFTAGADGLTGIHFPQDYPALRALFDTGMLSRDDFLINGQSGDFITGNHVPAALHDLSETTDIEARRDRVIAALIAKHFKEWSFLRAPGTITRIARRLARELDALPFPADPAGDHGAYEHAEFQDRQAKYTIAGQRVYEHFGMDWWLPLWDRDYLDFWAPAPLAAKRRQNLYRRVLEKQNWGGVFADDLPVNPTRIRPAWLVPLRLALKALHAPLGRDRWHAFERRFLGYWMIPLCSYAPWRWRDVARERRAHGPIAWYARDYLAAKGVDIADARVMMRVLCIDAEGGYGGSSRSLFESIRHIDRDRFAPEVWCCREGPIQARYAEIGVPCTVATVPRYSAVRRPSRNLYSLSRTFLDLFAKRATLARFAETINARFDLVHFNLESLFLAASWLRHHTQAAFVSHFRTMVAPTLFSRWQARTLAEALDGAVFITENERDRWRALGADRVAGQVIYNIVAPPADSVTPHEAIPMDARTRVACISNYAWVRGVDRLVEVAQRLRAAGRDDILFVLAGDMTLRGGLPGALGKIAAAGGDLADHARASGVGDMFLFTGHVSEPERVLVACDMVARPSRYNKSVGRETLEAMAAGKPVIATGRYDRFVEDDVTGLLHDDYDADRFAAAICRLADDRDLRARLGAAARDRIATLCDGPARAADMMAVWTRAAESRPAR